MYPAKLEELTEEPIEEIWGLKNSILGFIMKSKKILVFLNPKKRWDISEIIYVRGEIQEIKGTTHISVKRELPIKLKKNLYTTKTTVNFTTHQGCVDVIWKVEHTDEKLLSGRVVFVELSQEEWEALKEEGLIVKFED